MCRTRADRTANAATACVGLHAARRAPHRALTPWRLTRFSASCRPRPPPSHYRASARAPLGAAPRPSCSSGAPRGPWGTARSPSSGRPNQAIKLQGVQATRRAGDRATPLRYPTPVPPGAQLRRSAAQIPPKRRISQILRHAPRTWSRCTDPRGTPWSRSSYPSPWATHSCLRRRRWGHRDGHTTLGRAPSNTWRGPATRGERSMVVVWRDVGVWRWSVVWRPRDGE